MRWLRSSSTSAVALALGVAVAALVSACGGEKSASVSETQAPSTSWERVASMPQRRSYVAGAQIGDAIYAAGGMVGETGRPLATFSRYDPVADEWVNLTQLPV